MNGGGITASVPAGKWRVIYEANKGIIKNPNLIWPGQVFVMPAA